jgi:hypothetical protein
MGKGSPVPGEWLSCGHEASPQRHWESLDVQTYEQHCLRSLSSDFPYTEQDFGAPAAIPGLREIPNLEEPTVSQLCPEGSLSASILHRSFHGFLFWLCNW